MTERVHSSSGAIDHPGTLLWRILTTPIGPPLPGVRWARRRVRDAIAAGDLPAPLGRLVDRVTHRTRLWAREQEDVARELVSHFEAALAGGATPEAVIRDFGDARTAARLIRRAKKRARPLIWQAWLRAWQVLGACIAVLLGIYGLLALRLAIAEPSITHDYLADINAAALRVPESDRAWPIYEQASAALSPLPEHLRKDWGWVEPGDPRWNAATEFVRSNRDALELAHQAAAKPALGLVLVPPVGRSAGAPSSPHRSPPSEPPALDEALDFNAFHGVGWLSYLLLQDARLAEAELRSAAVADNLGALAALSEQLRHGPLMLSDSFSLATHSSAVRRFGDVLSRSPDLLSDEQIVGLCHRFAAYGGGGPIRLDFEADRPAFLDMVQRLYTDDGRGDGRLTARGLERLRGWAAPDTLDLWAGPVRPLVPSLAAGRERVIEEYDRLISAARAQAATPLRARSPADQRIERTRPGRGLVARARSVPLAQVLPDLDHVVFLADRVTQRRDAVLVAAALELHRRAEGSYPASLAELAPTRLPRVPEDQFDGAPIKYRLIDGRPLLYSVGADRDDDGGRPPPGALGTERAMGAAWAPTVRPSDADGDWVLWPRLIRAGNDEPAPGS